MEVTELTSTSIGTWVDRSGKAAIHGNEFLASGRVDEGRPGLKVPIMPPPIFPGEEETPLPVPPSASYIMLLMTSAEHHGHLQMSGRWGLRHTGSGCHACQ